jgi:hypothetical protein
MLILSAIFLSNFPLKLVMIFPHGDPERHLLSNFQLKMVMIFPPHGDPERHLSFKLSTINSSDLPAW